MTVWHLILIVVIWQAGSCFQAWCSYRREIARMQEDSANRREYLDALIKIQKDCIKPLTVSGNGV